MKFNELIKEIYKFAKQHNEPFTTAEAFNSIKEADDVTAVSNATRTLYIEGKLARKKIDGVRYSYALIENAPEDYETASGIKPAAVETKSGIAEPKPAETMLSVSEMKKLLAEHKHPVRTPAASLEKEKSETGAEPLEFKMGGALKLPEHFSLRLETPGGITITISAGV